MKHVSLEPLGVRVAVRTEQNVLQALLVEQLDVMMACGGKGMCATCHVHIEEGEDQLSPRSKREERTLGGVSMADDCSRLACQARVLGEGVVVRLPEGMFIGRTQDLMVLLGKRAEANLLHPVTGAVLVEKGKIITRSRIEELQYVDADVDAMNEEIERDS